MPKFNFSTEEMPKLWTIVDALNGDENAIMLLGVQDYTVEMIGTNLVPPKNESTCGSSIL